MKIRNLLLFLLGFLGVGAILDGGLLIISPSGNLLGTPLSMLDTSPFNDFLILGILLFFVIGLAPIVFIRALIKKPMYALAEYFNFFNQNDVGHFARPRYEVTLHY